jgi:GxxExxY protein
MISKQTINELTYKIIGACIEVHKNLGAGLLEKIYHQCLIKEFEIQKINFQEELVIPIIYKGNYLQTELRCDFFVENQIVVELKSVDSIHPVHESQILTYMKLLNIPKGILVNFNCTNLFLNGQRTYVNDLFKALPD